MKPYCRPMRTSLVSAFAGKARNRATSSVTPSPIGGREKEVPASTLCLEPAEEDAVEGVGAFDVGEMARLGDLLVATAGDELGDPLVAGGRRALVIGAADD